MKPMSVGSGTILKNHFTLIEVLLALGILAVAVTSTMYVLTASARRLQRAERFRTENHRLANAVEFFLLHPPGTAIDRDSFPYEDMDAVCSYANAELPDDVPHESEGRRLSAMTVELTDAGGRTVTAITLDRIIDSEGL